MIRRLTLLLMLIALPANAGNYVKLWNFSDPSIADGSHVDCRSPNLDSNTTDTGRVCPTALGFTITLTSICAGIRVATDIEKVSVILYNGDTAANEASSEIKFAEAPTCDTSDLTNGVSSTLLDGAGDYCCRDISLAFGSGNEWRVAFIRNDGTNDELQSVVFRLDGTRTKD